MSNRVEPEIPSITLDQDQVKSSRVQKASPKNSASSENLVTSNRSSKINSTFTFLIYIALAGSSWFFYQQNIKLNTLITHAEQRIQSLENQLSATGEEMGESTIALKAKLEAITEKADKLWGEMDKLWASAWRRNQSDIKELRTASQKQETLNKNQSTQITNAASAISAINDKLTSSELSINALTDQIAAANNIKAEISQLTAHMTTLEEKSSTRDAQQIEIATNVNQLEMSLTLLIERLEKLETAVAQLNAPAGSVPAQ